MAIKSRQKKSKKKVKPIESEVWPQERNLMARPDRIKYLRQSSSKDQKCVFCEARKKGPSLASLCLYKGKDAMVVLNKFPYNSGHLMVLPTRHCGELTELKPKEYQVMSELLLKTVKIVKKVYSTSEGINVGLNQGRVAGAGIPGHLHWHIIPRWFGDTNFFPLIAETKVLPETLEQTYERYKKQFSRFK